MPNYGYRCRSCQREFEVQQRMTDPPQAACPHCGGDGARLFYPTGILFKGSGFYKTDSRAPAAPTAAPGTGAAKPDADGATPPATATPPAEKPAPASSAPKESPKASPPKSAPLPQ